MLIQSLNDMSTLNHTTLEDSTALEFALANTLPVGTVVATNDDGVFCITELDATSSRVVDVLCRPGTQNQYTGYTGHRFLIKTTHVTHPNSHGEMVQVCRTVLVGYDPTFALYSEFPLRITPGFDVEPLTKFVPEMPPCPRHNGNKANKSHSVGRMVQTSRGLIWIKTSMLMSNRREWKGYVSQYPCADRPLVKHVRRLQLSAQYSKKSRASTVEVNN